VLGVFGVGCYFAVEDSWEDDSVVLGDISNVIKVTPWIVK